MRLLVVTNDYPPKPGGIQMYLENLVRAYPSDVLVVGPADARAPEDEPGVVRSDVSFMWPTRRIVSFVEDKVRRFAPDAVLFGAPHPLAQMGARLRERTGVPFGVLAHGAEVTLPAAVPGLRQVLGRSLAAADVRFAVSRFTAHNVETLSGKGAVFVGAGVDIDTFRPTVPSGNDVPVVGCVSRFVPRKGQHRLIEAVSRLGRPVRVLLVGKGRQEQQLRRLAAKSGVETEFAVDVPWSDLPSLYARMDVFCMPCSSRWGGLEAEGLGLVFLEAAAMGLPVLAGDSGGSPETVRPGATGFVVADVDDIVEGLEMLLADPEEAARMGAAGRKMVEAEFTWDRVVERLMGGFAAHMG